MQKNLKFFKKTARKTRIGPRRRRRPRALPPYYSWAQAYADDALQVITLWAQAYAGDALRVTRAVTRLTVYRPHQVRWQSTGTSASSRTYSCFLSSFLKKLSFFCINIYFLDFAGVRNVITRGHAERRPRLWTWRGGLIHEPVGRRRSKNDKKWKKWCFLNSLIMNPGSF